MRRSRAGSAALGARGADAKRPWSAVASGGTTRATALGARKRSEERAKLQGGIAAARLDTGYGIRIRRQSFRQSSRQSVFNHELPNSTTQQPNYS
ncbi:MAG: hypothetical protein LAT68_14895 [Cyclobacteriaceae bacterium]|nr:hypothetical protein [Cyclobacteriaceae bacterium]